MRWESMGFKGITIGDHVNGVTLDDSRFYPFWAAVEELGAVVFFHQASSTVVEHRTVRYGIPNVIGNLTERAITFATLVYGGIMDRYPDLKLCLGHAGGYTAFGAARMDKGWRAGALENMPEFDDSRTFLEHAPSEYLGRFYYDSCTYTEADAALSHRHGRGRPGRPRHRLPGADVPRRPGQLDQRPAARSHAEEKKAILEHNPARLLGI